MTVDISVNKAGINCHLLLNESCRRGRMVDVSIILATGNEKKHVGRTLGKALEASGEVEERGVGTEIIVVDNSGSAR